MVAEDGSRIHGEQRVDQQDKSDQQHNGGGGSQASSQFGRNALPIKNDDAAKQQRQYDQDGNIG